MIVSTQYTYKYLIFSCIVIVVALAIISYYYWISTIEVTMKMGNYVQLITIFIMLITGLIALLGFKHQLDDRERSMSLQYANLTQNELNDIEKLFMNNSLLNRLYVEMYDYIPQIQNIKEHYLYVDDNPDVIKAEQHMANIIFQKIADIYFCEKLSEETQENNIEWINTFKHWLRSPTLVGYWEHLKDEQHPKVIEFVDKIIGGS
jgi:hypothetical protein